MTKGNQGRSLPVLELADLWRVIISHKRWVFGMPIVASLVTAIGLNWVRPEWEATAVVQLGQVAGAAGPIEPIGRAIQRLYRADLGQLLTQEAAKSGLHRPRDEDVLLARRSLRVDQVGDIWIEVRLRAYSPDEAVLFARTLTGYLAEEHAKLANPTIVRVKQTLENVKAQIVFDRAAQGHLSKMLEVGARSQEGLQHLVLTNMLLTQAAELRNLEADKLAYEAQLDPYSTYPTSLVAKPTASDAAVFPNKKLFVALAGFAGLWAGILVAFFLNWLQRFKSEG